MTLIIPTIVWGYIFSYQEEWFLSKRRFFIWVISWWFSVLTVLLFQKLLIHFNNPIINPFSSLWNFPKFSILNLSSLFFTSFVILSFCLLFWILLFNKKTRENFKVIKSFLKNSFVFTWILISLILWIFYVFDLLPNLNFNINWWINFEWISFNTIKLVIFYYIIVALIEELSKYWLFISWNLSKRDLVKRQIAYSIIVAFWFGLIENMMYAVSRYSEFWLSEELFKTIALRSIFSISSHILFTSVLSYFYFKKDKKSIISRNLIIWLTVSVWLHTIYNVWLSLDKFQWLPIVFLIITYIVLTNLFYSEETIKKVEQSQ